MASRGVGKLTKPLDAPNHGHDGHKGAEEVVTFPLGKASVEMGGRGGRPARLPDAAKRTKHVDRGWASQNASPSPTQHCLPRHAVVIKLLNYLRTMYKVIFCHTYQVGL